MKIRFLYALLSIFALHALTFSANAQLKQITQILPDDPDWGCILNENGNRISVKGKFGRSTDISVSNAVKKLNRQRSRFRRVISRLKGRKKLSAKLKTKLRNAKRSLRNRSKLVKGVRRCKKGAKGLSVASSAQRSFAFTCQHAFNLRSVADGDNSCGIDLRSLLELKDEVDAGKRAFTLQGALRVVGDSLGDKCRENGGTYLTPEKPELFFPLYHGYCAEGGVIPKTFSVGRMPTVLGMDTINEDCLLSSRPASPTGAKDPCDCYDPDNRGGGGGSSGGGSGGGEKTPPTEEDCFVLRMDTINEDC